MTNLYVLCFLSAILYIQGCPNGAIQSDISPFCYRYFAAPASFSYAEGICNQYNGHLASITNTFINSFIQSTLNTISSDIYGSVWIGAFYNGPNWNWTDGQPFNYNKWGNGEPSNYYCVGFQPSTGTWYTRDCSNSYSFLCEIPNDSSTPRPPTPSQIDECDDGWTYYHQTDSCYKAFEHGLTWQDAEQSCVDNNAHLTSIHSLNENLFVSNLGKSGVYWATCVQIVNGIRMGFCCTWIGLYYNTANGSWIWSDGTPLDYLAWGPSRPLANTPHAHIISDESQDSLSLYQLWSNDHNGQKDRNFVCKKAPNRN